LLQVPAVSSTFFGLLMNPHSRKSLDAGLSNWPHGHVSRVKDVSFGCPNSMSTLGACIFGEAPRMKRQASIKARLRRHAYELGLAALLTIVALVALFWSALGAG